MASSYYYYNEPTKEIETTEGPVIGEILTSCSGKSYQSYSGIPYAQPPLGQLRFRPPVETEPRETVYNATKKGLKAYQGNSWPFFSGSEDCLYLNIYVPNLNDNEDAKLPVMVFIHGGSFQSGDGGTYVYGPDYIVDHDIILVTLNYRLGVFGFLTLGSDVAPGNLGLRDQQLALKWVKDNIHFFGGDHTKITIFGQSAGAISCMYHLVTPSRQGLFDQIIAQSGVFWDFYHLKTFAPDNGRCLAEQLGLQCDDKSNEEILEFLQNEDVMKIQIAAKLVEKDHTFYVVKYVPCIDSYCKDPFLPKDGYTLLKEGKYNQVPIITGTCKDDGLVFSYSFYDLGFEKMNEEWDKIGPKTLFKLPYGLSNDKLVELANKVRGYYFGKKPFGVDTFDIHTKMSGDQWFEAQSQLACTILSNISDKPVYKYRFDHEGKHSLLSYLYMSPLKFYIKTFLKLTTGYDIFSKLKAGVNHGDELNFIFRIRCFNADEVETDKMVKNHITKLWTNFAKYGKPTENETEWTKFSVSNSHKHYIINTKSGMATYDKNYTERMNFWIKEIIPALRLQSQPGAL